MKNFSLVKSEIHCLLQNHYQKMLLFFHFVRFECAVPAWAPGKCKNIYCSSAVAPVEVVWLYVFGSSLNIFTLLYAKPIDWLLYARAEFFVRLENLTKNWQVIQDFSPVTEVFQYLAMVSYYWQKKKKGRVTQNDWLLPYYWGMWEILYLEKIVLWQIVILFCFKLLRDFKREITLYAL